MQQYKSAFSVLLSLYCRPTSHSLQDFESESLQA